MSRTSSRAASRASASSCSTSCAAAAVSARSRSSGLGIAPPRRGLRRQLDHRLETLEALAQLLVLLLELLGARAQRRIALPPVDAHLPRALDRRDEQAQLDGQQLDVEQVDLDVAGDDDPLVEHALEDVGQVRRALGRAVQRADRGWPAEELVGHQDSSSGWPRW